MNSILQLKGRFEKRKNDVQFGIPKLPVNTKVTSEAYGCHVILAKEY